MNPRLTDAGDRESREALSEGHGLVYELIRKAILDGRYGPGDRLVEAQLATELGVSRTRIREALSGNLCRCTGYQGIVNAALDAAKRLQGVRP